jgi:hypothetical protein
MAGSGVGMNLRKIEANIAWEANILGVQVPKTSRGETGHKFDGFCGSIQLILCVKRMLEYRISELSYGR